jgi:hypothetical protein
VNGPLAARKISEAVLAEIEGLDGFDETFRQLLQQEACQADEERKIRARKLKADVGKVERELANLLKFIREGGDSPTLRAELQDVEQAKSSLEYESEQLKKKAADQLVIPTADELRRLTRKAVADLAHDDLEFADLMRRLIPKIVVFPYRSCDGGHIVLRAKFRLYLAGLHPDPRVRELLAKPLERIVTVDLFEPPQRIAYREQVVALRKTINPETGKVYTEKQVADQLGITHTAAQSAASLQRQMDELGLTGPYVSLHEPPEDYKKLRRHKHDRYSFEPLEGAGEF